MLKKCAKIPLLLSIFLIGILSWLHSGVEAPVGIGVDEAAFSNYIQTPDRATLADQFCFYAPDSGNDRQQPVSVENVEGEDTEFSEKKCPNALSMLAINDGTLFKVWSYGHFGKRLVYFNNNQCFYPLKHLFLLFEVFRL